VPLTPPNRPSRLRTLLREPLVHFLLLGAALFLLFQWRGAASASDRIVVTRGQVASLTAGFERTWLRPPTPEELQGLIDDHVREELAVREAQAQGLDVGDIVIRRRLRQKVEFLVGEETESAPPTDEELQRWLDGHPALYAREPAVAFRQVFVSPDRRGAAASTEAERLLTRLRAGADPASLGDATMLPAELPLSRLGDVGRDFGPEFAEALSALPTGTWSGPVRSAYGLHLVYPSEFVPGTQPTLDQIRAEVARDLLAARRAAQLDSFYLQLQDRHRVIIEAPAGEPSP